MLQSKFCSFQSEPSGPIRQSPPLKRNCADLDLRLQHCLRRPKDEPSDGKRIHRACNHRGAEFFRHGEHDDR